MRSMLTIPGIPSSLEAELGKLKREHQCRGPDWSLCGTTYSVTATIGTSRNSVAKYAASKLLCESTG
jgi:hypothetical protein